MHAAAAPKPRTHDQEVNALKSLNQGYPAQCGHYSVTTKVVNSIGLHARPAALLVRAAMSFECEIILSNGEDVVSAKSILGVLALGAGLGTAIRIEAEGLQAQEAIMSLKQLFENGFGED